MKHDPQVTANALAATMAIVFVACRLLVGMLPGFMFGMAQSWFHGVALTRMSSWSVSTPTFLFGLISATVSAWLTGYLFATLYNYFLKR